MRMSFPFHMGSVSHFEYGRVIPLTVSLSLTHTHTHTHPSLHLCYCITLLINTHTHTHTHPSLHLCYCITLLIHTHTHTHPCIWHGPRVLFCFHLILSFSFFSFFCLFFCSPA